MKKAITKPHETVVTRDMLLNHVQEITGIPNEYHRGYTCQELLEMLAEYQKAGKVELRLNINHLIGIYDKKGD
jgi:hypothetical protein